MDIPRQVARLTEICEVLIDFVGTKQVEKRLDERRRDRESVRTAAAENGWTEKVAGGDARAVKVISADSYIFGVAPGNRPVCGPVKYIAEEERGRLIGGLVGATYTISGEPTIIRAAFEETAQAAEAGNKATDGEEAAMGKIGKKSRRNRRRR